MKRNVGKWLREPLVHFLVAGLLVFVISAWRGSDVDPESRSITISEAQVVRLSANWEQVWRRPPTPAEIDLLIRDFIKEEVYYREAKRLGLDLDDVVIRRRLRSKMEYLAGAQVESARPDDAILQAWLDKFPARFATDPQYSFDQIYLGSDDPIGAAPIRKALDNQADWTGLGKPISLPQSLENSNRSDIERQFGDSFADAIASAKSGQWIGPIASGFGLHLVRVRNVATAGVPRLSEVRQTVENDWRSATYKQREAKAYQALLDGYTIKIVTR